MTDKINLKKNLGLFSKLTLLFTATLVFSGCASSSKIAVPAGTTTDKSVSKEPKFVVINEKDLDEQYKLSQNYIKAFVTLFNTGDYKELLKYLPSNVQPRNVRSMYQMMKKDFARLGQIKETKFAVRLKRHLMTDFYWKSTFIPKIDGKDITLEYLYKIVIVKDKNGKNQIVKADFIFK